MAYTALGFVSLGAQRADAAAFTIASQIVINQAGVSGTIDPVFDLSGTLGLTSGGTDFVLNDAMIFDITLSAGSASIGGVDMAVTPGGFFEPIGAGAFTDSGEQAPSAVVHIPLDPTFFTGGIGSFTFLPGQIDAGETTVRMFVTYSLGSIGSGDGANFDISSGASFTVNGTVTSVPEPSTILLLGGGLVGLSAHRRRWKRRVEPESSRPLAASC